MASLQLTLALFILLGVGLLVITLFDFQHALFVAVCMILLALNLLAHLLTKPRLRQQGPLLVFHLALLAVIVLVGLGRLVYLNGQAEVLEGEAFEGKLVGIDAGIWHPWRLDQVSFVNHGFQISYAPGLKRQETRNRVSWTDVAGAVQEQVIGDDKPLVLNGYRFYTSWNKGFSLLFEWLPTAGEPLLGSVNLPGYPGNALKQAQQWHLPGVREPVWAMLQFEGDLIDANSDSRFRLPDDYRVVVRYGDGRWELIPGRDETVDLPGGRLRYAGLRTWMGYTVTWDATIPWLLGACTLAVLALGWHFWRQFSRRPWNPGGEGES
jgi:cytochrome c biogenesis protein